MNSNLSLLPLFLPLLELMESLEKIPNFAVDIETHVVSVSVVDRRVARSDCRVIDEPERSPTLLQFPILLHLAGPVTFPSVRVTVSSTDIGNVVGAFFACSKIACLLLEDVLRGFAMKLTFFVLG